MTEPEWLEPDVVQFLHDQALREFGGLHGVRDEGLLAAALARPQQKLVYATVAPDLYDLAASYAFGIVRDHPFNDGNKRTGWACCVLFLLVNGVAIVVSAAEAVAWMVRLAEGECGEDGFARWLGQPG